MKIAIIGAGLTGLCTAYYIQKNINADIDIADIDIYEEKNYIGGLASTIKFENTYIEKYYHHIFTHDKYYLDLAKDLNLYKDILWKKSKIGFYSQKIYPFTTIFDLLKFKPLNLI